MIATLGSAMSSLPRYRWSRADGRNRKVLLAIFASRAEDNALTEVRRRRPPPRRNAGHRELVYIEASKHRELPNQYVRSDQDRGTVAAAVHRVPDHVYEATPDGRMARQVSQR